MKPRISLATSQEAPVQVWRCTSPGGTWGAGYTPKDAYTSWFNAYNYNQNVSRPGAFISQGQNAGFDPDPCPSFWRRVLMGMK